MSLLRIVVGPLSENSYVLAPGDAGECVVIDPGAEGERIVAEIRRAGLTVRHIAVTHGHGDHTGAVASVQRSVGGAFTAHPGDSGQIASPPAWVALTLPDFVPPPEIDRLLRDGDVLELAGGNIEVIATPGHTPGSICFLFENVLLTGDTLFKGAIGRYDLPGGDGRQEIESIRTRLLTLPADTNVMPGHGPSTTIRDEREMNPFLRTPQPD